MVLVDYRFKHDIVTFGGVSKVMINWSEHRFSDEDFGVQEGAKIPSDIAICGDCRAELLDSKNRRNGYFFISCRCHIFQIYFVKFSKINHSRVLFQNPRIPEQFE